MKELLYTTIGRLRIAGALEGISLLVLVFIGVPLKHLMHMPELVRLLGPIHGALFLLYLFLALSTAIEYRWNKSTTAKILLASLVPFGTFYVDRRILSRLS